MAQTLSVSVFATESHPLCTGLMRANSRTRSYFLAHTVQAPYARNIVARRALGPDAKLVIARPTQAGRAGGTMFFNKLTSRRFARKSPRLPTYLEPTRS